MLRVGITGGIGSGKSTVSKVFETLGIPVYNADLATRKLMDEDQDLIKQITAAFGKASYKEGKLDRTYIASKVFGHPAELEKLNAISHPFAINDSIKWMQAQQTSYAIKEAALFFESGSAEYLDSIIGVSAPQHLRIQRIMQRDQISREKVLDRINNQLDETIKMKLCDVVLINDEQQPLLDQVLLLHQMLLEKAAAI